VNVTVDPLMQAVEVVCSRHPTIRIGKRRIVPRFALERLLACA
jgi:hypothetical protein